MFILLMNIINLLKQFKKYKRIMNFTNIITSTKTLKGHNNCVKSVAISKNSKFIVSGSKDSTIKIWNFHTYKILRTIINDNFTLISVWSVVITQNDKYFVLGSSDSTVKIYNFTTGILQTIFFGHKFRIWTL